MTNNLFIDLGDEPCQIRVLAQGADLFLEGEVSGYRFRVPISRPDAGRLSEKLKKVIRLAVAYEHGEKDDYAEYQALAGEGADEQ